MCAVNIELRHHPIEADHLSMKNGLICLLIVATLTLFMTNVAAAPANKQTTNVYSGFAMDASVKEHPRLVLLLSNNVTTVNTSVSIYGQLATVTNGRIHGIEGATVKIQHINQDGTVLTERALTTMSGVFSGCFSASITPKDPGIYICRATFDGDNIYAPAVSEEVPLIAISR